MCSGVNQTGLFYNWILFFDEYGSVWLGHVNQTVFSIQIEPRARITTVHPRNERSRAVQSRFTVVHRRWMRRFPSAFFLRSYFLDEIMGTGFIADCLPVNRICRMAIICRCPTDGTPTWRPTSQYVVYLRLFRCSQMHHRPRSNHTRALDRLSDRTSHQRLRSGRIRKTTASRPRPRPCTPKMADRPPRTPGPRARIPRSTSRSHRRRTAR